MKQGRIKRWIAVGILCMGVIGICILYIRHQKEAQRDYGTWSWQEESVESETENRLEGRTEERERQAEGQIAESIQRGTGNFTESEEGTDAFKDGTETDGPGTEIPEQGAAFGEEWMKEPVTGQKETESENDGTGNLEQDSSMPDPESEFTIRGDNKSIRETFLSVETDFRSLAEYHAEKIHSSVLCSVTFLEPLAETAQELAWMISLEYADHENHGMVATYHFNPGYTMLEEPENYEARMKEETKKNSYLSSLKPEVTVARIEDWERLKEGFLSDEENFIRETGEYLYRTFGQAKVSEIRIEYLLKEEENSETWRITLVGPDGDETPVSCTYYGVLSFYSFVLVTEF